MGELLKTHPGGSDGDEDGSGANPRPGKVSEQEQSDPPKLVGDGGGAQYRIWRNPSRVVSFRSRLIL